jgi:CBS domain-containing protein
MFVKEIMSGDVKTIRPEDTVRLLSELLVKNQIGSMVVVSGSGEVVGIATERDIIRDIVLPGKNPNDVRVEEIMTSENITVGPDSTLEDAAETMVSNKIKKLPVIDRGRLVGIVTATDLIAYENRLVEKVAHLIMSSPYKNIGG